MNDKDKAKLIDIISKIDGTEDEIEKAIAAAQILLADTDTPAYETALGRDMDRLYEKYYYSLIGSDKDKARWRLAEELDAPYFERKTKEEAIEWCNAEIRWQRIRIGGWGILTIIPAIATYFVAYKWDAPDVLQVVVSQLAVLITLAALQQISRHIAKEADRRDIKSRIEEGKPLQGIKGKGDTYGNT